MAESHVLQVLGVGALCTVAFTVVVGSLYFGGGLRRGRVVRNHVILEPGDFVWLDEVTLRSREGLEVWAEYLMGPGARARVTCRLAKKVDGAESAPVSAARTVSVTKPKARAGGPGWIRPEDKSAVLTPETAGRYVLGTRLASERYGKVSMEISWCPTVVLGHRGLVRRLLDRSKTEKLANP